MEDSTYFLVQYRDPKDNKCVSIKAKTIVDSSLGLSFVALSNFIFDTDSILVNPEEESRKLEFEDIKTLHLSIYSILSIAEAGTNPKKLKFKDNKANLLVLQKSPTPNTPTN